MADAVVIYVEVYYWALNTSPINLFHFELIRVFCSCLNNFHYIFHHVIIAVSISSLNSSNDLRTRIS